MHGRLPGNSSVQDRKVAMRSAFIHSFIHSFTHLNSGGGVSLMCLLAGQRGRNSEQNPAPGTHGFQGSAEGYGVGAVRGSTRTSL